MKKQFFLLILLLVGLCITVSADNVFRRAASKVGDFFKYENPSANDSTNNVSTNAPEKADNPIRDVVARNESLEEIYGKTFSENLRYPKLGGQRAKIKDYQRTQARKLISAGEKIETTRGGEVIIATIACSDLFFANEATLKPNAVKRLRPYAGLMNEEDFYRMLVVAHSDNTGSEDYTYDLTSRRVVAILDWFKANAKASDLIIPYAFGASSPLAPNNSVDNRERNRRIEIYLVPGKEMISRASKSQL